MKIEQLSENGYQLLDVFDSTLYTKLESFIDTFIPNNDNWPAGDSPKLPALKSTARREVFSLLKDKDLKPQILSSLSGLNISNKLNAILLWRDYLGYRNLLHCDPYPVQHVCIIYFGNSDTTNMGTVYYENGKEHIVPFKENSGIFLKNSCNIEHGMMGEVSIDCRKSLYVNWKPE